MVINHFVHGLQVAKHYWLNQKCILYFPTIGFFHVLRMNNSAANDLAFTLGWKSPCEKWYYFPRNYSLTMGLICSVNCLYLQVSWKIYLQRPYVLGIVKQLIDIENNDHHEVTTGIAGLKGFSLYSPAVQATIQACFWFNTLFTSQFKKIYNMLKKISKYDK